jgi:hypothetical protein
VKIDDDPFYIGFDLAWGEVRAGGGVDAARKLVANLSDRLRAGTLTGREAEWLADRLARLARSGDERRLTTFVRGRGRPSNAGRDVEIFLKVQDLREQGVPAQSAYAEAAKGRPISPKTVEEIYLRVKAELEEADVESSRIVNEAKRQNSVYRSE